MQLLKTPHTFREEILALPREKLQNPVIIDEIQKIPPLLDEIHWLIENSDAYFIMSGSSARKLKKGAAKRKKRRSRRGNSFSYCRGEKCAFYPPKASFAADEIMKIAAKYPLSVVHISPVYPLMLAKSRVLYDHTGK